MEKNLTTQNTKNGFSKMLDNPAVKQRIQEVLGERKTQFITSALSLYNSNNQLQKCDPASIFNACLTATSLGMPINNNLGFAYIIPYGTQAQFQIGYKGFRQLAINTNQYKQIEVKEVFEGQLIEDESFKGYHFNWKEKKSEKVVGYASYFMLLNGFESIYFMSVEDIEKHAKKYSQTYKKYGTGLWKDDKSKMSKKTVVKLHLNSGFAPLSIEMQKAIQTDQAVINDDGTYYVDNTEDVDAEIVQEEDLRILDFIEKATTTSELKKVKTSLDEDLKIKFEKELTNKENELILKEETK